MDWSPEINYHVAYSEALDTPNLAESSLSVTSLGDRPMRTLVFVNIIEEVAHVYAQNASFE